VIAAHARGIPDEHYPGDMVIGCVGVETVLLTECGMPPPIVRSAFDPTTAQKYVGFFPCSLTPATFSLTLTASMLVLSKLGSSIHYIPQSLA